MKKLFATLAVLFSIASFAQTRPDLANTRLELPNDAGGKIVLKFSVCEIDGRVFNGLYELYSYSSNGNTSMGCWTYTDKKIRVLWENGKQSIFEPSHFEIIKD